MNDVSDTVTVRVHASIAEIRAATWDACAGEINPTVSHTFLNALEESGSTIKRTGWTPLHLSLEGSDGKIISVVPLYAKTHSYGEYIFDAVADHSGRLGRDAGQRACGLQCRACPGHRWAKLYRQNVAYAGRTTS